MCVHNVNVTLSCRCEVRLRWFYFLLPAIRPFHNSSSKHQPLYSEWPDLCLPHQILPQALNKCKLSLDNPSLIFYSLRTEAQRGLLQLWRSSILLRLPTTCHHMDTSETCGSLCLGQWVPGPRSVLFHLLAIPPASHSGTRQCEFSCDQDSPSPTRRHPEGHNRLIPGPGLQVSHTE